MTLLARCWLIPRWGIAGAAETVMVSAGALLLGGALLLLCRVPYALGKEETPPCA